METKVKLLYMNIERTSPTTLLLLGEKNTEIFDGRYFQTNIELKDVSEMDIIYNNLKLFVEMAGCDCTIDIPCEKHKYLYKSKAA